jgi:ligand-binding SRPBCC domain-containing protein
VDAETLYHMKITIKTTLIPIAFKTTTEEKQMERYKIFCQMFTYPKALKWVSTNKDYAVAIDRIVYDFDLNDPTDIYFLEDDEKFTELAGKTVR